MFNSILESQNSKGFKTKNPPLLFASGVCASISFDNCGPPSFSQKQLRLSSYCVVANPRIFPALITACSFRYEPLDQDSPGLLKAEKLVEEGLGLLTLITHFSRPDPVHAMRFLSESDVLARLRIVAPIAQHQMLPKIVGLQRNGHRVGVDLFPIVTRNTVARAQRKEPDTKLQVGEGQGAFNHAAVEMLKRGGIVVMAPQAERQPKLNLPEGRPVAAFVTNAMRHDLKDFAVMFMGFEIAGAVDCGRLSGFNFGSKYAAHVGRTFRLSEMLGTTSLKDLDLFACQQLAACSPPAYRGFQIAEGLVANFSS